VPDFDYNARPTARLEIPIAQRIAEIRARKAEERARGAARQGRQARGPQGFHGSGQGTASRTDGAPGGPPRDGAPSRFARNRQRFRPRRSR
jgi:ATP-dependent RNA helicase RhlE